MAASIEELARMANTSISTVSRALTGKAGVGKDKRENIRVLAERVGYRPNQFARNLLSKKSHTLGFVTANLGNPTHTEFLRLMETAARDRGYQMLIADSRGSLDLERENIEALLRNRVEGFVLFPVSDGNLEFGVSHLLDLHAQRVPFVVAGDVQDYYLDSIISDEVDAGKRLARRLLELGHRRFGVVGGNSQSRTARKRCQGVVEALREAGLLTTDMDHDSLVLRRLEVPATIGDDWLGQVVDWLREEARPTALVCINDPIALRLIRPLRQAGLLVPRDVSVVAFDDNAWCRYVETTLTTMAPRIEEVAQLLFEMLMRRIENPMAPPVLRAIPQEYHERESVGPAPISGNEVEADRLSAKGEE